MACRGLSPTQKGLKILRQIGYLPVDVQRRIKTKDAYISQDYLGLMDYHALKPGSSLLGINFTNNGNHANHSRVYLANPKKHAHLMFWLQCGFRFQIWSFPKFRITDFRLKKDGEIESIHLDEPLFS
jgi:hypothetical protein